MNEKEKKRTEMKEYTDMFIILAYTHKNNKKGTHTQSYEYVGRSNEDMHTFQDSLLGPWYQCRRRPLSRFSDPARLRLVRPHQPSSQRFFLLLQLRMDSAPGGMCVSE